MPPHVLPRWIAKQSTLFTAILSLHVHLHMCRHLKGCRSRVTGKFRWHRIKICQIARPESPSGAAMPQAIACIRPKAVWPDSRGGTGTAGPGEISAKVPLMLQSFFFYHILWCLNIENTPYGGLKFSYALLVSITFYEQICFFD